MKQAKDIFQKSYEMLYQFHVKPPFDLYKHDFINNFFDNLKVDFYDLSKSTILSLSAEETIILRMRYGVYNDNVWQTLSSVGAYFGKNVNFVNSKLSRIEKLIIKDFSLKFEKYVDSLYKTVCVTEFFDINELPNFIHENTTIGDLLKTKMLYIFNNCNREERNLLFRTISKFNLKFVEDEYIYLFRLLFEKAELDYSKVSITDLNLTIGTYNFLVKIGIRTLQDIIQRKNLVRILGKKRYAEIEKILQILGIINIDVAEKNDCEEDEIFVLEDNSKISIQQLREQYFEKQDEIFELEHQIEILTEQLRMKECEERFLLAQIYEEKTKK